MFGYYLNLALRSFKRNKALTALMVLAIALGALTVVVLMVLSIAVLVQFWDTEHRRLVAWLLAGGWALVWIIGLWRLLAAANQLSNPFKLTRNELKADWKAMKEKI